jgi:hypothetical protein
MISTQFGSEVKITGTTVLKGKKVIEATREEDGQVFLFYPLELRADGGLDEIEAAVNAIDPTFFT